ncbi:MAG: DUF4416 family protein [Candidatus Aureabacteria bacterium]|nr:DUF4416 family protein [Candidatus Auribacterota bacterium]
MGNIVYPEPKQLICGILLSQDISKEKFLSLLQKELGVIEDISIEKNFDIFSDYYKNELGKDLKRFFISFKDLFDPKDLAELKIKTNDIENRLFDSPETGCRKVNLDPGYLDLARLVVASTKDASYRVYLKSGIYAQPMLRYMYGSFKPFEWTYTDYIDEDFISFFDMVRIKYKQRSDKN